MWCCYTCCIISNNDGGDVLIHLSKGRNGYLGNESNNIISNSFSATEQAFYFNNSPLPYKFECQTLAIEKLKPASGSK